MISHFNYIPKLNIDEPYLKLKLAILTIRQKAEIYTNILIYSVLK